MKAPGRSPFKPMAQRGQSPFTAMVSKLPASVLLVDRSLIGSSAVDDLRILSLEVRQRDSVSHALTVLSAGASYTGTLTRWQDSTGVAVTQVDNAGIFNTEQYIGQRELGSAPGTPTSGGTRLYPLDKAGVSNLYWKNDAGTQFDLSLTGTTTGLFQESQAFAVEGDEQHSPADPYVTIARWGVD